MGRPIIWSGSNAKLINSGDFIDSKNNSLTNGAKITITQAHGWTSADIGKALYYSGTIWDFADCSDPVRAEVAGFLYDVIDANTARIALNGVIPNVGANFLEVFGPLVPGEVYFLSSVYAGSATPTEPTILGYISKPIGVAISTTSFLAFNFRGSTVGGTNLRTQLTLSNFTTGTIQNFSAYDAGEITGWVFIDATTNYRFLIKAQFAKNGAASNWNVAFQTVGDTPPAGFSIGITSGGILQYTMPNVSGFTSAYINYALNAPALGTAFPLSIDAGAITSGILDQSTLPLVNSSFRGAFPSLTSSLDDGTATQLGLKQYLHGTTYNGGNAPTVTSAQAGFGIDKAVFLPYQLQNGTWRLKFNIAAFFTSFTGTSLVLNVAGITSVTTSNVNQSITASTSSGTAICPMSAYVIFNTNTFSAYFSSFTLSKIFMSGDIELSAKPTWAY